MKVLFVPMPEGGIAHLIPLLALNRMLNDTSIQTAFLVVAEAREFLRRLGINVLDIGHRSFGDNGFRTELRAYMKYEPDVVVDDASLATGLATTLAHVPRVTVQRTGMFPGVAPRNKDYSHSIRVLGSIGNLPDVTFLGVPQPRAFSDLFKAEMKIVPGIPSIEVLPPPLRDDPTYFFSGPLLMDDYLMPQTGEQAWNDECVGSLSNFDPLRDFFEKHHGRRIIYATFGTTAKPDAALLDGLRYLLAEGFAVVSSMKMEGLCPLQQELYYFAPYLPMRFICAHAHLVIHQCGSGTYHYPIMGHVPTITIGTRCFDREDVAQRLVELGVSVHLPGPEERTDFLSLFRHAIEDYFAGDGARLREKKQRLVAINEEIESISSAFDFAQVLRRAAVAGKDAPAAAG